MIHLEGQQCVLAALLARRRRIELVLLKHDIPAAKTEDVLAAADAAGVPVKRVAAAELTASNTSAERPGLSSRRCC
jgi:tRNA G18 (ribose-2'-O)-methylase SpoU